MADGMLPEENLLNGKVQIADDVIAIIAGIAANEVAGIHHMTGNFGSDLGEVFGRKNFSKGVKVEIVDKDVTIDISIVLEYGFRIPTVAEQVQENVKNRTETMTGMNVVAVNVHVTGVAFPDNKETTTVTVSGGKGDNE
jgi:uncharacterized alkaline shock family protein YloU